MNCKYLSLLLFILLQTGCGSSHHDSTKELKKTTSDNDPELITAKKAIRFIESNQLDSLKSMFPQEIRENAPDIVWQEVISKGQKAISNSDFPSDSLVQVTRTINLNNGRRQAFAQLSFPFTYRATKDSTNI